MNAVVPPDMIDDRFEIYRVVTDYAALCEAFSERVEDLQATRLGVDAAGGFALGHASTLLCRPQIKGYGPESLTHMLKATGMVMVLAIDDEQFAKVRERLGRRERPLRSNVRSARPRWLFTRSKASKISKKRWATVPPEQRKKLMKKLAKASWRARRRKAKSAQVEVTA